MGMFVTDKYGIRLSVVSHWSHSELAWRHHPPLLDVHLDFCRQSDRRSLRRTNDGGPRAVVLPLLVAQGRRILVPGTPASSGQRSEFCRESPRSGTRHPRSHNPRQRPSARRISYPIEFAHPRPRYHRHGNDHRSPQRPPAHASIASMDMSNSPPFFHGLFLLFKNKSFYIQMLTFGFAFALQWSVFVIGETMFVELGYKGISGYIMALSAVTGCISSILAGMLVDKTKKFNEIIKFCYFGGAVFAVAINLFLRHQKSSGLDTAVFIVLLSMLGWFYIPPFPIGLELGVETTFPVAEATSSGVLVTAGQLVMFVLSSVMAEAVKVDWIYADDLKGLMKPNAYFTKNHQLAIDFWCLAAIFAAFFTFFSLWPRYRRLEFEESTELVKNVNGSDSIESR
ncbi:hypothetical protein L596_028401 [Steinernema carpocapsae]|uniref:Major facilitator superfamily (MFS) profile domain-containing protein n=1 Tax=Steinernema carpocapsae TaxID=34508 RepID=A0A4U5LYF4_STECR|nr:hypothetical protein L596_028401 [Steinernema carpocapsae]